MWSEDVADRHRPPSDFLLDMKVHILHLAGGLVHVSNRVPIAAI